MTSAFFWQIPTSLCPASFCTLRPNLPVIPGVSWLPTLSQWCHPNIASSVTLFSSCPQSFPASGAFPMSHLFVSGGQSVGASTSVLPMNIHSWYPLRLTDLISLLSRGLSRVFSNIIIWKHQFFGTQPSLWSSSHIRTWLLENLKLWQNRPLLGKVMSLVFNTLSRFVKAFLPRSRSLLIHGCSYPSQWFWSPMQTLPLTQGVCDI